MERHVVTDRAAWVIFKFVVEESTLPTSGKASQQALNERLLISENIWCTHIDAQRRE